MLECSSGYIYSDKAKWSLVIFMGCIYISDMITTINLIIIMEDQLDLQLIFN